MKAAPRPPMVPQPLRIDGQRIRELRLARGWGTEVLARRARISRTTLHHIEKNQTLSPRAATLRKLAAALGMPAEELLIGGSVRTTETLTERHVFDRQTNPVVDQVLAQRPRLFDSWQGHDWEELYSEFGMGGPLTPSGVIQAATRINRKRESLRQMAVILETDLAEVAAGVIEVLYRMVQDPAFLSGSGPKPRSGAARPGRRRRRQHPEATS